ncbi:Uncharacterised protein [[Clostridium] sordellii]|nr:hypothetical protein [Paeniclostridium sordellii]CEQ01613.1 Uncharacterised protein [[Clostridium] sordellii] [Paeniclostridium sordellii]
MRANLSFINITKEINDNELMKIIKRYPDSPIWCDKDFMNRVK